MALVGMQLGRYTVGSLLGSGGMGEVYQAEDMHIRRKVALKIVRHELAAYPNKESQQEAERLFRREIRAIANLDHPYILPLYDYGEETINESIYAYMVMPLRPEGSLAQWLRERSDAGQRLQPGEIAALIRQAARALHYAHKHQIVHQDVKPSNFLTRNNEETPQLPDIQLADFGIARLSSATASHSQTSRGTPSYMAPEQWSGEPVPATDQYALACMAYQLLTGEPPFRGRQEQIMYQHFHTMPQASRTLYNDIPTKVDEVLFHALAKKPEERFPDILAFATEVQLALNINNPNQTLTIQRTTPPPFTPTPSNPCLPASPKETPNLQILRATLAISDTEALSGTTRTLTLPGGNKASVQVPPGASEGQIIRLDKQGDLQQELHVTIAIKRPEEERLIQQDQIAPKTEWARPPVPPISGNVMQPVAKGFLRRNKRNPLLVGLTILILLGIVGSSISYFTGLNYVQRLALLQTGEKNPYGDHAGTLVLNDPLQDNSNGYSWFVANDENGSCQFTTGVYRVFSTEKRGWYGCYIGSAYSNFTYEVQMKIKQGSYGGVSFQGSSNGNKHYYLNIGTDGSCTLLTYQENKNNLQLVNTNVLLTNSNNIISGTTNMLAVSVLNHVIIVYINHQQIKQIVDDTITNDPMQIGDVAGGPDGNPTVVDFSNAKVWQ